MFFKKSSFVGWRNILKLILLIIRSLKVSFPCKNTYYVHPIDFNEIRLNLSCKVVVSNRFSDDLPIWGSFERNTQIKLFF